MCVRVSGSSRRLRFPLAPSPAVVHRLSLSDKTFSELNCCKASLKSNYATDRLRMEGREIHSDAYLALFTRLKQCIGRKKEARNPR